jgi:hypothetical protein
MDSPGEFGNVFAPHIGKETQTQVFYEAVSFHARQPFYILLQVGRCRSSLLVCNGERP